MGKYEKTRTCENYFEILDKVEKMEKVLWIFYNLVWVFTLTMVCNIKSLNKVVMGTENKM